MAFLTYSTRLSNAGGHRRYDDNGYLFVDESPILRAGILEYLGEELIDGGSPDVDGQKIDPEKTYKVYISPEELAKGADSFRLLPLVNGHEWLGMDGEDAKGRQEGSSGEKVTIKGDMLFVPLKFTGDGILADLKNGKEELSASYTNKLSLSDNPEYDLIASDIKGNHIALVERGRCGSDVRVLNNRMEKSEMKSKNEVKLVVDGKAIDLGKFFEQEAGEDAHEDTGSITDSNNDSIDKRAVIDEVGGILKGKVDEEVWRTVIEKLEKLAYDGSETSESDNSASGEDDQKQGTDEPAVNNDDGAGCGEDKKDDPARVANYDSIYSKLAAAFDKKRAEETAGLKRAYNAASSVIGEFNPFGMSEREMLVKALNHQGIATGKEGVKELYAMLNVCRTQTKVDNGFDYSEAGASDEVKINI